METSALCYNVLNSDFKLFLLLSNPQLKVIESLGSYDDVDEDCSRAMKMLKKVIWQVISGVRRSLQERRSDGGKRVLQAKNTDLFSTYDVYMQFYNITVSYVRSKTTKENGSIVQKMSNFPINLIPC